MILERNKGITLIETIVAIAVFGVVVTIALGALLGVISGNSKISATQAGIDDLNSVLDQMARDIGSGTLYYCGESSGFQSPSSDCEISGSESFSFLSQDSEYITYRVADESIERGIDNSNYASISSDKVKVNDLKFYVYGNEDADILPKVFITVRGEVDAIQEVPSVFSIQLTASQRPSKEPVLARKSKADDVCQLEPVDGRIIVKFFGDYDTQISNNHTLNLGRAKPAARWDENVINITNQSGGIGQFPENAEGSILDEDRENCIIDFKGATKNPSRNVYNWTSQGGSIPNGGVVNASFPFSRCLSIIYELDTPISSGQYDILLSSMTNYADSPPLNEWQRAGFPGRFDDPHNTFYIELLDSSLNPIASTERTKSLLDYRFFFEQEYWGDNKFFRILKPATEVATDLNVNRDVYYIKAHLDDPGVTESDYTTVGVTPLCAAFDTIDFDKVKIREF